MTKMTINHKINFIPIIIDIISFGLFVIFGSLIAVLSIIFFRLSEPANMHIGILLGLTGSIVLFSIIFRLKNKSFLKLQSVVILSILFITLSEIFLLIITPLHSLIPESILINLQIIRKVENGRKCNSESEVQTAVNFFHKQIDISQLKIYIGGESRIVPYFGMILPQIKASTYGNFIYISDTEPCITASTLVHELVHVWQFQKGMGFGARWIYYWINYYWIYFTNFYSLYEYGGWLGLINAKNSGKNFVGFGLEQQAMIVENYYKIISGNYLVTNPDLFNSDSYKALNYFVSQEFSFK